MFKNRMGFVCMCNYSVELWWYVNKIFITTYCRTFLSFTYRGIFLAMATRKDSGKDKRVLENASLVSGDASDKSSESEIRELFRLFDTNNDRSISSQELGKAMRFLGMTPTEQQVTDAMRTLDVDRSGRIEFREFHAFMQKEIDKINDSSFANNGETVRSAFRTFDRDGNGYIDQKELRVAMKNLGEALTDKELDDMMRQADIDGDGKINYEEFVKIWCEAT
ncbi:neo-calmodulin-like isoform X2 [Dreissena polymorpha]|uniref:neo-calmodulin-like isoform X2 n=1 Tax=Dreissena polymorpha TaxID=45954 RepID=UPI002264CF3F|nr:neo-calmodulin-like isoform X2 [Dreissena polymorpha]